jgi:hypothetical protein
MAVTWTIATLERNTDGNGVVVAHWRASDSEVVGEETHSGSSYGTAGFTPDAEAEGYIAYDALTEADVIGWVQADVDAEAIEASIAAQIAASKEPVTAAGVPW